MLSLLDIVMFAIGAVLLALYLILFAIGLGGRDRDIFDRLDEKEYPFKELYFMGHALMGLIRYEYKSPNDRKLRKEISILYGEVYAEYYIRVIHAQKVSLSLTVLMLAVPMYGLANDITAALIVVMFAGLAFYYFGTVTSTQILKRSEEMLSDFSDMVSKLALLTNAGMNLREAWETVAKGGNTLLYKEMRTTVNEIKNGISDSAAVYRSAEEQRLSAEAQAFYNFGVRCVVPEIKKFASTISQALTRGNSDITTMLQTQSKEVWAAKKQKVRRQGEQASSKLLLPMMIMLIGILVMVIIPIFANLGV